MLLHICNPVQYKISNAIYWEAFDLGVKQNKIMKLQ